MSITKQRQKDSYTTLAKTFRYTNALQSPRIIKVIVSTGVGKKHDARQIEMIEDRLAKITGQKAAKRTARVSIASFKVRAGETVGLQVTLRGARMYDFVDKLIHIALPRTRDFRGIPANAIDDMGNITIGIREHSIFPETSDEDLKDIFGCAITIVTTATSRTEAEAFLRHIGLPLVIDSGVKH